MLFGIQCPKCGGKNKKDARYCCECGSPLAESQCPACNAAVAPDARFCPACGKAINVAAPAAGEKTHENRWARTPDVFAARLDGSDMDSLVGRRLVVEPGCRAMIFQSGKYLGVLSPGIHTSETLLHRINPFAADVPSSAILVEDGDVEVRLAYARLATQDYQDATASLSALIRIKDPEPFVTQLLRGRNQMATEELREWLSDEIRTIVASYVNGRRAKDFAPDTAIRKQIEDELHLEMNQSLARCGLELVRVRFVDFSCPTYEAEIRKAGARLDLAEEQLALKERAGKIGDLARQLENKDFIGRFQSRRDLEDYVAQVEHETGLKGLLRRDEAAAGLADFDKNELARRQTLERVKFELELENRRLEAKLRGEIVEEDFQRQAHLDRMRLEQQLANDRLQYLAEREKELQRVRDGLDQKLAGAKTQAEIAAIEREQDKADAELGLMLLEKTKEVQRREERERVMLELEAEERRSRLAMERDRAGAEIRLAEMKAKGAMSPEQLLALVAGESPEAARALAEKFKAEGSSKEDQIATLRDFLARQDGQRREEADRIERMAGRAMEQLGAAAQAGAARPETAAYLAGQPVGFGIPRKVLVCPKCETENLVGSKFCQFCGEKL
jgi:hypothetical protein